MAVEVLISLATGEPVHMQEQPARWGRKEGPPKFGVVVVPDAAREHLEDLFDNLGMKMAKDGRFAELTDPDEVWQLIEQEEQKLGRAKSRLSLGQSLRQQLERDGKANVNRSQLRQLIHDPYKERPDGDGSSIRNSR